VGGTRGRTLACTSAACGSCPAPGSRSRAGHLPTEHPSFNCASPRCTPYLTHKHKLSTHLDCRPGSAGTEAPSAVLESGYQPSVPQRQQAVLLLLCRGEKQEGKVCQQNARIPRLQSGEGFSARSKPTGQQSQIVVWFDRRDRLLFQRGAVNECQLSHFIIVFSYIQSIKIP